MVFSDVFRAGSGARFSYGWGVSAFLDSDYGFKITDFSVSDR